MRTMTKWAVTAAFVIGIGTTLGASAKAQTPASIGANMAATSLGFTSSNVNIKGSKPPSLAQSVLGASGDSFAPSLASGAGCVGGESSGFRAAFISGQHATLVNKDCNKQQAANEFRILGAYFLEHGITSITLSNGKKLKTADLFVSTIQVLCSQHSVSDSGAAACGDISGHASVAHKPLASNDNTASHAKVAANDNSSAPTPKPVAQEVMYDAPSVPVHMSTNKLNVWANRCFHGQVRNGATFCAAIGVAESTS